ncbi:MAG TPA: hypothetical protein VG826_14515 [Pirellulales bacterium]|nr:hypothetical protein [Pirellulales bacterium]
MAGLLTKLKPTRRWMQVSLRTVLVLVTLLCVALSLWVVPAERQRRAVAAIRTRGGMVQYADPDLHPGEPAAKRMLRRWLPQDFLDGVDYVVLRSDVQVTGDDLAQLQSLAGLKSLGLGSNSGACDRDLVLLRGLDGLEFLIASGNPITDLGLTHLAHLRSLDQLYLDRTLVTGAGLTRLTGQIRLTALSLDDCPVTDSGLDGLRGQAGLHFLSLNGTQVTDAGLACLCDFLQLRGLGLDRTLITGIGLAHLRELPRLERLKLNHTLLTDAGLVYLEELKSLQRLDLVGTQTTDAAVARLRKALPNCTVVGP